MGLIHTPRVLISIARGWIQRRNHLRSIEAKHGRPNEATTTAAASVAQSKAPSALHLPPASGMGPNHGRHVYEARAGLIDYAFGHLNNAAYLTHAELARWQMLAYAGLFPHMTKTSTHLVVAGTTVRYRKEIKPFRCTFRIESYFGRIEGPRVWTIHDFFVRDSASSHDLASARSRAQMVVPCVWVQRGNVVDPQSYLQEAGVDEATKQSLCGDTSDANDDEASTNSILKDVTSQYAALEESMRRMDSLRDK
jgi:acyl-CoA thioesterase FadM